VRLVADADVELARPQLPVVQSRDLGRLIARSWTGAGPAGTPGADRQPGRRAIVTVS
jgi:hypothetical protein